MGPTGLIVLRIVASLMVLIGLVGLYGAARLFFRNNKVHGWPTVTGTILRSDLTSRKTRGPDGRRSTIYGAGVVYTYEVNGKTYESDMVQLGGNAETSVAKGHARRAAKYQEGGKVKVYYDPTDPGMATLEPGETGGIFNLAMVGGGFVLVGAIVILMSIIAPQH